MCAFKLAPRLAKFRTQSRCHCINYIILSFSASRLRTASHVASSIGFRDIRSDSVDSDVVELLVRTKEAIIDLRRVPGVDKLGNYIMYL